MAEPTDCCRPDSHGAGDSAGGQVPAARGANEAAGRAVQLPPDGLQVQSSEGCRATAGLSARRCENATACCRTIFETLYLLLASGHATPEEADKYDPPTNFFRIRLICMLLSTCGQYFSKGSAGQRLDRFLVYFQRYLLYKPPLPLDVEFDVQVRAACKNALSAVRIGGRLCARGRRCRTCWGS